MTYVLIWLAVTATAVFIAAAAVGSVRDQVTEAPTAMIPTTTVTTLAPASPSDPGADAGSAPATSAPTTTTPTTTTVAPSTTLPDVSATTTEPPAPTTTTTVPTTTTTTPPPLEIRSYELIGGSVTVEVGNGTVGLAGASPKAGFSMDVENSGAERVEVEFKSDHHESKFSGRFRDGVFTPEIEESDREEDD